MKYHDEYGRGLVFSNPGEGFKENRTEVMSVLSPQSLEKHRGLLEKEADDLVKRLVEDTAAHGSTNPRTILRLSTLNVIMSLGVGQRFESIEDPEFIELEYRLHEAFNMLSLKYNIGDMLPALSFLDRLLGNHTYFKNHLSHTNALLCNILDKAYKRAEPNFAKSMREENPQLTEKHIATMLAEFLTAGIDTTAVALSWIIAILCNYPDVQAKIRDELDLFIKTHGRVPQFPEKNETPYCYSVIRETFRYRDQTTLGIPHYVREDIVVDGYLIPAGSNLVPNSAHMHFDSTHYGDPHQFIPDRFISYTTSMAASANGKITERDHYGFGWGRRVCPGINLADMEIYNACVRIFSGCIVEPDKDMPDIVNRDYLALSHVPLPYTVKFTPRT